MTRATLLRFFAVCWRPLLSCPATRHAPRRGAQLVDWAANRAGLDALCGLLACTTTLHTLDFSRLPLRDVACSRIGLALAANRTVQYLALGSVR